MGNMFFYLLCLFFIAFAVAYERLFAQGRPIWIRILIWLAVGFVYLVVLSLPITLWQFHFTTRVSRGFLYDMHRLTGVTSDESLCAFPEADLFWLYFLMALFVASPVCGIPAAIMLVRKGRARLAKKLLLFSLMIDLVCMPVGEGACVYADTMTRARHYFFACKAEIERIDALDLDKAERMTFYEDGLRKMGWTYEGDLFDRMEGFLNRLKAYPPAPKDAPKE